MSPWRKTALMASLLLALWVPIPLDASPPPRVKGVYHRVKPGENLKRIAEAYRVSLQVLVETNRIENPDRIEVDSVLFIPHAKRVIDNIVPRPPAGRPQTTPDKAVANGPPAPTRQKEDRDRPPGRDADRPETPAKRAVPMQDEKGLMDDVPAGPTQAKAKANDPLPPPPPTRQGSPAPFTRVQPEANRPRDPLPPPPLTRQDSPAPSPRVKPEAKRPQDPIPPSPPPGEGSPAPSTQAKPEATQPSEAVKPDKEGFIWPLRGRVTSRFGRQPNGMHLNGIRIAGRGGRAVVAAARGVVIYSALLKDYGETVIIKHDRHYATVYTRLGERSVKVGQTVRQGSRIGLSDKSDRRGEGIIHFEIRQFNKAIDPLPLLH